MTTKCRPNAVYFGLFYRKRSVLTSECIEDRNKEMNKTDEHD